jgi:hypothetical protein
MHTHAHAHSGEPRQLLTLLNHPEHPLASNPESAAALEELATLFDYLEVRESEAWERAWGPRACAQHTRVHTRHPHSV